MLQIQTILRLFHLNKTSCVISGIYLRDRKEPASTEFAFTRFLVPYLCGYKGPAVFVDCDFVFTTDIQDLFYNFEEGLAARVVKHDYVPRAATKMDGQPQIAYPRKNWSSLILWNCGHNSNRKLTPLYVNTATPAELHRFDWLLNSEIGKLDLKWNWLVGEYDKTDELPFAIHYTNGGPWFENHEDCDYSEVYYLYRDKLYPSKEEEEPKRGLFTRILRKMLRLD